MDGATLTEISCVAMTGFGSLTTRLFVIARIAFANSSAESISGKAGANVPMSSL